MDLNVSSVLYNKRYILLKAEYKIMEKLFSLHSKNKIDNKTFKEKIVAHKTKLLHIFKEVEKTNIFLEKEVLNEGREKEFMIMEFLLINDFSKTSKLFAEKNNFNVEGLSNFYFEYNRIINSINNNDTAEALDFLKKYRMFIKKMAFEGEPAENIEKLIRIYEFQRICNEVSNVSAYMYAKKNFNPQDPIYCAALKGMVGKEFRNKISKDDIVMAFKRVYMKLYNQTVGTKLTRRIIYGVIAYKTASCGNQAHPDCPTCSEIVSGIVKKAPITKKDYSIVLCSATGKVMNDKNLPYAFDSGYLYSTTYTKKCDLNYYCVKTGKCTLLEPKKCFFL